MIKVAILGVAVILVLGGTASSDQLIASWENTMDHFTTGDNFDSVFFLTDIGVTEGMYALGLNLKPGITQGLVSDGSWQSFFPQLTGAQYLRMDVTSNRTMFNNPGGSGTVQLGLVMQGQAGDGSVFNMDYGYQLITPTYYPEATYATETIEWDMMAGIRQLLPPYDSETGGWFEMRITTSVSAEIADPGIIVIDNLWSVEPPDTITGLGDYNGDANVDMMDYLLWSENFGKPCSELFWPGSYAPLDHDINTTEYTIWADNFGAMYVPDYPGGPGGTPINVTIPEPATMAMLAFGAASLLRRKRA